MGLYAWAAATPMQMTYTRISLDRTLQLLVLKHPTKLKKQQLHHDIDEILAVLGMVSKHAPDRLVS